MPRKSRTPYAILGALSHGSKSGYDINCFFERRQLFFWNESYGQIYPTLKRLLGEGHVEVTLDAREQGPDRKVYSITESGEEELRAWVRDRALSSSARDELLLKLHFGSQETKTTLVARLEKLEEQLKEQLDGLAAEQEGIKGEGEGGEEDHVYRQLTMMWALDFHAAKLAWCKDALKELGARKKKKAKSEKKKKKRRKKKSK